MFFCTLGIQEQQKFKNLVTASRDSVNLVSLEIPDFLQHVNVDCKRLFIESIVEIMNWAMWCNISGEEESQDADEKAERKPKTEPAFPVESSSWNSFSMTSQNFEDPINPEIPSEIPSEATT